MKVEEPETFRITIRASGNSRPFEIEDASGAARFSGRATSKLPKLYVVTANERPIYVGITKRPMRERLRSGWAADGKHGYHGYRWRHHYTEAALDVWYQIDAAAADPLHDIEAIEAEVVFLIRKQGQWPLGQTEIHFHESTPEHRALAEMILSHYAET